MSEFDRWEGRFAAEEYVFGTAPNQFLSQQAKHLVAGAKALSIADGEGRNGVWLAEQGLQVTAQDFSPTAQNKARKLAQTRGVDLTFELSDLTKRRWEPDTYDVVVGIFFQFLSPVDRAAAFMGIRDTLKPDGLLLIEGYGPKQLEYGTGGPKILENLYTEDMLCEAFDGFTDLSVIAYDEEVSEGAGHHGLSALVDVIGRK
ncbi:MAG: class I SAM-dependent methyltransferase [Tateyamaria sp.]|jgi:SAM-dependent methyltransferase|nr:class I SAM-dependent methyltransferase [Tateyamaria sp.]